MSESTPPQKIMSTPPKEEAGETEETSPLSPLHYFVPGVSSHSSSSSAESSENGGEEAQQDQATTSRDSNRVENKQQHEHDETCPPLQFPGRLASLSSIEEEEEEDETNEDDAASATSPPVDSTTSPPVPEENALLSSFGVTVSAASPIAPALDSTCTGASPPRGTVSTLATKAAAEAAIAPILDFATSVLASSEDSNDSPLLVFEDGDDDNEEDDCTVGLISNSGSDSVFRLSLKQEKDRRTSSEIMARLEDDYDTKQGSASNSNGSEESLPLFDDEICSDSPALWVPAIAPATQLAESKQESDDDEEWSNADAVNSVVTRIRDRLYTVRLSSDEQDDDTSFQRASSFQAAVGSPQQDGELTIPIDQALVSTVASHTNLLDVEAGHDSRNLAISVTLMAAFSTGVFAFRANPPADILSALFACMLISVGTLRGALRYNKHSRRNRETRVDLKDEMLRRSASLVLLSGFVVFASSLLFIISRIIGDTSMEDAAFWLNSVANLVVLVAILHFIRKLFELLNLWWILSKKLGQEPSLELRAIHRLTVAQVMAALLRMGAAISVVVALLWSVAVKGSLVVKNSSMPLWFALGAITVIGASSIFPIMLKRCFFSRRDSHLQIAMICDLFRDEIGEIFRETSALVVTDSLGNNAPDDHQQRRHQCWEHAVQEFLYRHRFDNILAPVRLQVLLQHLQAMEHTDVI